MNKPVSGPIIIAVAAVLCIGLAIVGYKFFAGNRPGQKPALDPVLNRMYGPHPIVSDHSAPANTQAKPQ